MYELDIIIMQQCKQLSQCTYLTDGYIQSSLGSERHWPTCTCPAYRFSRATIDFNGRKVRPLCKHINKIFETRCNWHENFSPEVQTEEQKKNKVCPRCGGETELVRVGV